VSITVNRQILFTDEQKFTQKKEKKEK